MKAPRVTFEQVIRPLLAFVLIFTFGGTIYAEQAAATTEVRTYELPASVQDARTACYDSERDSRGVPSEQNAYVTWWNANEGTSAQLQWTAAFEACKSANPMPGGKWNFAGMTLVRVEQVS